MTERSIISGILRSCSVTDASKQDVLKISRRNSHTDGAMRMPHEMN